MRYTANERYEAIDRAMSCGLTYDHAVAVRRIALTLRRWYELECNGEIQRDEVTNKPYWVSEWGARWTTGKRCRRLIPDRETGALKRLKAIMAKYAPLQAYVQTDPRGGTIYLIRPGDIPDGSKVEECYSRGVFIA